jgi:hypothetical protein
MIDMISIYYYSFMSRMVEFKIIYKIFGIVQIIAINPNLVTINSFL